MRISNENAGIRACVIVFILTPIRLRSGLFGDYIEQFSQPQLPHSEIILYFGKMRKRTHRNGPWVDGLMGWLINWLVF